MTIHSPFPSAYPSAYRSICWQRIIPATIATAVGLRHYGTLELPKSQAKSLCFECAIAVVAANPHITIDSVPIASAHLNPAAVVRHP
jgi:hypothetical protein